MVNELTYELSPEETSGNSSTGYLVFNGRPDYETAEPLTSLEDFKNVIRASTEDEALDDLRKAGWTECKSAKLEEWKFPVNGVNDLCYRGVGTATPLRPSSRVRRQRACPNPHLNPLSLAAAPRCLTGRGCIDEIKHDGYRLIERQPVGSLDQGHEPTPSGLQPDQF